MKYFPEKLDVRNKEEFSILYYNRSLCYLRKTLYEHIISEDENSYFDIDAWCRKNIKNDVEMMSKMIGTLQEELQDLGWKTKLSFGSSGLFIFSKDVPSSCYEDGL